MDVCATMKEWRLRRAGSMADRFVDKIRRFRQKGQHDRAWHTLEDAIAAEAESLELRREQLALSFDQSDWQKALETFGLTLKHYSLFELCKDENRAAFFELLEQHEGFRSGLTDLFTQKGRLMPFADWMDLAEPVHQRMALDDWQKQAMDTTSPLKDAFLNGGLGVAYTVMGNLDKSWEHWQKAVAMEPRLLKDIMAFAQKTKHLNTRKLAVRIKLVSLILSSGKRSEALQLLQAMGKENRDNAFKVLVEVPTLFPDDNSREVLELRYYLAIYLEDREILEKIISEMGSLSENDLFELKKAAVLTLKDPALRRSILLKFGEIYMEQSNWESAGLLLEGLFHEQAHPDVVRAMETVLEHYPILPELQFKVGRYYLDRNEQGRGLHFLSNIQSVGEYQNRIRKLLEDMLHRGYNPTCANMLFEMLQAGTHRAGLLAFMIVNQEELLEPTFLDRLEVYEESKAPPSPFWMLACLHGFVKGKRYDAAFQTLGRFLFHYPDLSPEVVKLAEKICNKHRTDFRDFVQYLDSNSDILKPARAWKALGRHFIEATERFKAREAAKSQQKETPSPEDLRTGPLVTMSTLEDAEDPDFKAYFAAFQEKLMTRRWGDAAAYAVKTANESPLWIDAILEQLLKLKTSQPQEPAWHRARLEILVSNQRYTEAVSEGQQALNTINIQEQLPDFYQLLAEAHKGAGKQTEALRFYCLASRRPAFYKRNREAMRSLLFPQNHHMLKDVLNLVLSNEDQGLWEAILRQWNEARPQDIEVLVKAQETFTKQMKTPKSVLDLAFWYLQAENISKVDETLGRLDLRDAAIREQLIQIASLVNMKYPQDPKPTFLLGRFYLEHQEVPKAVDTFRNLTSHVPNAAETVYQYLRSYLKSHHEGSGTVHLYGLLIRIALDYDFLLPAVKLLEEFGHRDKAKAETLAEGVYRVLHRKSGKSLEPLFAFGQLLHQWGAFGRLLIVNEQSGFGTHMANQRMQWLVSIKCMPELHDRAAMQMAQLYLDIQEFESCREELSQIRDPEIRSEGLLLYQKLTQRFPDNLALWREAAWSFVRKTLEDAKPYFERIFNDESADPFHRLEACAVLRECAMEADLQAIAMRLTNGEDGALSLLREVYGKLREMELDRFHRNGGEVPVTAMHWLLSRGRLHRFDKLFEKVKGLDQKTMTHLRASRLRAEGRLLAAGQLVASAPELDEGFRQSCLVEAHLPELAVFIKEPGHRLPHFIRSAYINTQGRPHIIAANFLHHQLMQSQQAAEEE
jgi:tetratricopeptide (TPR) repeat protein